MKIKQGAATSIIRRDKIDDVHFTSNESHTSEVIYLWINDSLSYLSIEEAVALRDEINAALKEALKLT